MTTNPSTMNAPAHAAAPEVAKFFFGWFIVALCFFEMAIVVGMGAYSFSFFVIPIAHEFGGSRAAISIALSIQAVALAISFTLVGYLGQLLGAKKILVAAPLGNAICFFFLSRLSSLAMLYWFNLLLGVFITGGSVVPVSILISHWFVRRRGTALGICLVGVATGAFISSQALHWIIQSHGWRAGYLLAAIVSIALPLPLGLILVEHPADMGLLADGDGPAEAKPADGDDKAVPTPNGSWSGLPLIDALRTRAFGLLCASTALHFVALQGVLGHLVPMVLSGHYVGRIAALALGLTVGLSAAGRIGFGYLSDFYSKKLMYAAAMFAVAGGIAMLFGIGRWAICLTLFIAFFGIGTGGSELLPVMLVGEYFGPAAMGPLVGLVFGISLLIGSIGPFITGKLYDLTMTYWDAYLGLFVIAALGAIAVLGMSKPSAGTASMPFGGM